MKVAAIKQLICFYLLCSRSSSKRGNDGGSFSILKKLKPNENENANSQFKNTITIKLPNELKENAIKSIENLRGVKFIICDMLREISIANKYSNINSFIELYKKSQSSASQFIELHGQLVCFRDCMAKINKFLIEKEAQVTIGSNNVLDNSICILVESIYLLRIFDAYQIICYFWLDFVKFNFIKFVNDNKGFHESLKKKIESPKPSPEEPNTNSKDKSVNALLFLDKNEKKYISALNYFQGICCLFFRIDISVLSEEEKTFFQDRRDSFKKFAKNFIPIYKNLGKGNIVEYAKASGYCEFDLITFKIAFEDCISQFPNYFEKNNSILQKYVCELLPYYDAKRQELSKAQ